MLALPWLLPLSAVPDAVIYNQLAALAAWAVWLMLRRDAPLWRKVWPPLAALGICAAFAAAGGFALQGGVVPVMLMAAVVMAAASADTADAGVRPIALALWVAGLGSAVVAVLQFAAPALTGGGLVAAGAAAGRATGNLRQPNHLATALLCGMVMMTWLWQAGRIGTRVGVASMAVMVLGVALSASRTGALSLVVLTAWAIADRQLPRAARWTLGLAPLGYGLCWLLLAAQSHYYGAERLESSGDISSSRFAIWRNACELISMQPWAGVGWGHFNLAWTFTPFPDRPIAFFDHTHNLPLQLAVEIGLPATAVVLVLVGWALWRGRTGCRAGPAAPTARAALAMLAVLGLHSLLEYPLWYAYFLLPMAWAIGVYVGAAAQRPGGPGRASVAVVRLVGLAMLLGTAYAAWDHHRVEAIFAPARDAKPLDARIAEGRKSVLFGHHADYAAVTIAPTDVPLEAFRRPLRQLVDTRLLIAYSEALRAKGREAEALYAAQRLREFRRPEAQAWFEACAAGGDPPPFQCDQRPVVSNWRALSR